VATSSIWRKRYRIARRLVKTLVPHEESPLDSEKVLRQQNLQTVLTYRRMTGRNRTARHATSLTGGCFHHVDIVQRNILVTNDDDHPVHGAINWEEGGCFTAYSEQGLESVNRARRVGKWSYPRHRSRT
jgi:hypothetical protein